MHTELLLAEAGRAQSNAPPTSLIQSRYSIVDIFCLVSYLLNSAEFGALILSTSGARNYTVTLHVYMYADGDAFNVGFYRSSLSLL